MLPSIIVLGAAALFALAMSRASPVGKVAERNAAARSLLLATAIQSIHFVEEAATGFSERFPALFDLPPIPLSIFLTFNLIWILIWVASIPGLQSSRPVAFFAAWFLAIAGALNGIAHPILSVAAGGYFPGLVTSPFIGAAAVLLWINLARATREVVGRPT